MLKGISPLISPELLAVLHRMGHGDEIVFADAHFPAHSTNQQVIRADGLQISALLDGVLPLFELDSYVPHPAIMMAPVEGDQADPTVAASYLEVLHRRATPSIELAFIERFDFYARAQNAFAIVMTGDTKKYGNIMLKKGVTPQH